MQWGQMRLNALTTSPGVPLDLVDEWLNSRYTTILEATDWIGLKAHTTVQTLAAYQSGADTVTTTVGSIWIDGVGTAWTIDMTGLQFYVPGDTAVYRVSFNDVDRFMLDRPYEGQSGAPIGTVRTGAPYVLMQNIYPLPADCRSITTVLDARTSLPLTPFTKDALDQTAGTRATLGYPASWAEYDDTPEPNQPIVHQIEFYPPPIDALGYTLEYLKTANQFDGQNLSTSPLPFISTAAIMAGVRADIAIWQEKPTQAVAYQKLFEFELAKLLQVEHSQRRVKTAMKMAPRFTRHRLERLDRSAGLYFGLYTDAGGGSVGPSVLEIASTPLPPGTVGVAYTAVAPASGGTRPYTYSAAGLPAGLSIDPATGAITGFPTAPTGGIVAVTVTATDVTSPLHMTASTIGLVVNIAAGGPTLAISNHPLPNGMVGAVYGASETASGGVAPYTYSATGLPSGLSVAPATGVISGTPTSTGVAAVTITVTDSGSPTQIASTSGLTITVAPATLTITSTPLPAGTVGVAYSASETISGGTAPFTYSATALPGGLAINPATGVISGTPTTAGATAVTITVTGSASPPQVASTSGLTITIAAGVPAVPAGFAARYLASSITPVANGAALASWPDSGPGLYHATQGVAANRPVYVTAAQTIAGLQPGVWFGSDTAGNNYGGNAQLFFTIPSGLATNLVSCTIFVIGESGYSSELYGPMVGLGQSSGIGPANLQQSLGFHKSGAWNGLSVTPLPTGPFAVCLESTAAAVTLTTEYSSATAGGSAATALTGGAIGSAYASASSGGSAPFYCYQGMIQEIVIYAGTITPAQRTALFQYAAATYGTATAKRPYNLIWYGNSIFLEWGAQTNGGMTAVSAKNAKTGYSLMNGVNTGAPGSGFTQQNSNVNYTKSLFDPTATMNIVCLFDGDTDLVNGLTAAQIYTQHQTLAQTLQAAGFKVVSSSLTNHNYAGAQLTTFQQYNTLLRQTPIGDAFADIAANQHFAIYDAPYMSDTSHPNNAGHLIMAPIFDAAILSLLGGGGGALAISSNPLPNGTTGVVYSLSQYASGGKTPYTYSAVGLPAGLSINPANGMITGTPTAATVGAVNVTITVTDATTPTPQTASTTGLTITIASGAPTLSISNNALPGASVGTAYSASQTASGGTAPYTYSATGLPPGLSIAPSTGVISGTPTTATGSPFAVTVTATDSTTPTHQTASTSGLTIAVSSGGAGGNITIVHTSPGSDLIGSGGITFPSTTAGNTMIIFICFRQSSTDTITSITGLGVAAQVPGARSFNTSDGRAVDMWQCLNVPGGVTTAVINQTGSGTMAIVFMEITTDKGTITLDAASHTTNATTSTGTATGSAITTTGSKDFIAAFITSTPFGYPGPPNPAQPPLNPANGLNDGHQNPIWTGTNVTPQTFTPTVTVTGFPGGYSLECAAWTTV